MVRSSKVAFLVCVEPALKSKDLFPAHSQGCNVNFFVPPKKIVSTMTHLFNVVDNT